MDKILFIIEDSLKRKGYNVICGLRLLIMNIKIFLNLLFLIDVDFVLGFYLGDEVVMIFDLVIMYLGLIRMNFFRFGFMKWISKENFCMCE